ncbi:hypothetical protein [Planococcus halocryophilus]|uniref:hypothetical protein n=1 Tax=Planococcus halocryophilus TaxID=1215089 RepID=UPI001F10C3F1|nr:hypothetical protein [Planococcus halocryophilus]MCH4825597.1 hypothetical protein [Planococcus halocryophilus]
MPLFRGKASEAIPADSTNSMKGYVAANISITKKPAYREVSIIVIDCVTGDTLYKSQFRSKARNDFAAHNHALDNINAYLVTEGYVLHDEPTTNADLPSITSHLKGGRW